MKIPVDSLVNHTVLSAPVNHQKDATVHFNFHLSGDESPEQSRRIANAVLALGGLTTDTQVGKLTVGIDIDPELTDEERAERKAKYDEFGAQEDGSVIEKGAPPAPPVPSTPEVSNVVPSADKAGLPWDERIHSSSRAINADGTWRYRKNVPDETKRDVEAELRGLVATNGMDESEKGFEDAYSGPTIEVTTVEGTVNHVPAVPVPPTPPAPPVPTGGVPRTYSDVVNLIMARKVQPETYVAILGMSLPEFAKHVISAPNDATLMFDALDQASRT